MFKRSGIAAVSVLVMVCGWGAVLLMGQEASQAGEGPFGLALHFPDRLHAFVWRNWQSVSLERMGQVLATTPEAIAEIGQSMGLPEQGVISDVYLQRGYISLIRRNWHLISREQMLKLLGWSEQEFAFTLREDDFLWVKLGGEQSNTPPLLYVPPSEAAKERCGQIRAVVAKYFGQALAEPPAEEPFAFVEKLSRPTGEKIEKPAAGQEEAIRFIYSYFASFGDPLLHPELNPYPEGMLERLSRVGVNGVWMHVVLRQLAPDGLFGEFGQDHEKRLATLRGMVEQAGKYGIKIYLYMNEPRAMPDAFFEKEGRQEVKGTAEGGYSALCTSTPQVRQYVKDSLTYIFKNVPGLGGVFTISASENLTSCWSHGGGAGCPRCSQRTAAEVIAEINSTIAEGVWAGNPDAKVMFWDWGWQNEWVESLVSLLPQQAYLMSVSEWDLVVEHSGIQTNIGEYSISAVGPGPRASRHWEYAKKHGMKTMAKVAFNNTWELSAVPFIPAMNLVAEHCRNLTAAGVDGYMLSWSLGGYPSPNLQIAREFSERKDSTVEQVLAKVAQDNYGAAAEEDVLRAWGRFSAAFREHPYTGLYTAPYQNGPANPLYPAATGCGATMVGFPFDHVDAWRGHFPAEVYAEQFAKMARLWKPGLSDFEKALGRQEEAGYRARLREDYTIAQVCWLYFRSVANQTRFILARNALATEGVKPEERVKHAEAMQKAAEEERAIAVQMFHLSRRDSRIGFEASNHYYYFPLDFVEKVINCEYILQDWLAGVDKQSPVVAAGAEAARLAGGFAFTEGPAADAAGNVFFSDIPNNRIHKWSVEGKLTTFLEDSGGANGLMFDGGGNLISCAGGSRQVVSIDPGGKAAVLAERYNQKKFNSPNDLWIDPKGGIYFTDPRYGNQDGMEQGGEHVYYLTPDRSQVIRVAGDLVRPNGVIGTPDGTKLYIADHGDSNTYEYRINADGTLADKKLFAASGSDGMTMDERGNVYLTNQADSTVDVYNPQGKKLAAIQIPERPANICFGGKDGKTLFITAMTSLYAIPMQVRGNN